MHKGEEAKSYWLTGDQAIRLCMFACTDRAKAMRDVIQSAFTAYTQMTASPVLDVPVLPPRRRPLFTHYAEAGTALRIAEHARPDGVGRIRGGPANNRDPDVRKPSEKREPLRELDDTRSGGRERAGFS